MSVRVRGPRFAAAGSVAIPHGTFSGYNYHRCRCVECRTVLALYRRRGPYRQQSEEKMRKRKAWNDRMPWPSGYADVQPFNRISA